MYTPTRTDKHMQTGTPGMHSHKCRHIHKVFRINRQKHSDAYTQRQRHTQTHPDTHRHTQTHTDTHRHTQTHRHTDTQTHRRTSANECHWGPLETQQVRYLCIPSGYRTRWVLIGTDMNRTGCVPMEYSSSGYTPRTQRVRCLWAPMHNHHKYAHKYALLSSQTMHNCGCTLAPMDGSPKEARNYGT
jgi:hypothetical protein